jgi:hypothetical protein
MTDEKKSALNSYFDFISELNAARYNKFAA